MISMEKIILISNNARSMLLFRLCFMKKLLSLGFEVIVCSPYEQTSFEALEKLGVKTESLIINRDGMNPLQEISSLLQIRKILSRHKPQACIFYTIKPVIYGSLACRSLGMTNVYSMIPGLGYVFVGNTWLKKVLQLSVKIAYRIALKNNKKVLFLNKDDANYFISAKIVTNSQAYLSNGEGVDLSCYTYTAPQKEQIEFLFMGRLLRDKGIGEYVAAARILKNKHKTAVFKVVGGIDDNPSSIEKAELQSWINEGIIDYCGYLIDVRIALKSSSVFVLPSYYKEGMPVSILEAMAIGRPIITTNTPGCRETVEDEVNGFLVPIKNIDALVVAMERFILNPELIAKMGEESRKIVEAKFNVNDVVQKIITVMELS